MAVASAGPYASLHLTPDRLPHQHLTTQFFTGRMPFLPPNQQCQNTEGTLPTRWRRKTAAIDVKQNYVTVAPLCLVQ